MRFRLKIMLAMISILAVLFGCAGSAFITISFQNSLQREKDSAKASYSLLLSTLKLMGKIDVWTDGKDAAEALNRLSEQRYQQGDSVLLMSGDTVLSVQGSKEDFVTKDTAADPKYVKVHMNQSEGGKRFLQFANTLQVQDEVLKLYVAYDISDLYEGRALQMNIYYVVFAVMILLCAVGSYSISRILTRPLEKLSLASREIASGDFSCRSDVSTDDEIGELSVHFDSMAEQVEQNILELKDSVRRQELFMGNFAHELKTPMTSVIGYADLLRKGMLTDDEQQEAFQYIFSEGKRLERLSLKLLDIYTANNRELDLVRTEPAKLIEKTVGYLRPILNKKNIILSCSCEEGSCMLDRELVQSLILNLADNSRKALESGGSIEICSRMTELGCSISVTDNGRGIPKEALAHLTEAFYCIDKSRSRRKGGAGLGLALCDRIAGLHHGTLVFESSEGEGTKVTADLKGGRV